MENLQSIAKAFAKLLDIEYRMIIGRKGKTTEITLRFDASHFHHLAGFHILLPVCHFRWQWDRARGTKFASALSVCRMAARQAGKSCKCCSLGEIVIRY